MKPGDREPAAEPVDGTLDLDAIRLEVVEAVDEGDKSDDTPLSPEAIGDAVYEILRVRLRNARAAEPVDESRVALRAWDSWRSAHRGAPSGDAFLAGWNAANRDSAAEPVDGTLRRWLDAVSAAEALGWTWADGMKHVKGVHPLTGDLYSAHAAAALAATPAPTGGAHVHDFDGREWCRGCHKRWEPGDDGPTGGALDAVGERTPLPHELWAQANGDRAEYLRLMEVHGHLTPTGGALGGRIDVERLAQALSEWNGFDPHSEFKPWAEQIIRSYIRAARLSGEPMDGEPT